MTRLIPFTPSANRPKVATIGFFDGVHLGHLYLFGQVRREAEARHLATLAITFDRHPRQVLQADYQPALLNTTDEKLDRLKLAGLDACAVLDFGREMSALTAREFMAEYLKGQFGVEVLVIGYDHHFGSDRLAGFDDYRAIGKELGIEVVQSQPFQTAEFTVSSSTVRRLLQGGDVERARQCLGYPYQLAGTVVEGHHVGHDLGFPTANLRPACPDKLIPGRGVYAVEAEVGGKTYGAMLNIGWRPTLDNGAESSIESHIFDFDGNIYGQSLTLRFLHRIRDEHRFSSLEALKAQLQADAVEAQQFLNAPH
ncbi:MAG: riboflavin biosynthesis protein RibF [Bacteroidales bacterium]|nr:riboflavin biosynthesis protein RibF [Bacteroidales bacterium]